MIIIFIIVKQGVIIYKDVLMVKYCYCQVICSKYKFRLFGGWKQL